MRTRIIATIAATAFILGLSAQAAGAAPSTCEIMYKLGVRNVRECENPTS